MNMNPKVRVLYSYPFKLGADRICYTAWQQVNGLALSGAEVIAFPGVLHKPLPNNVLIHPTLSKGKFRISYKIAGRMRACALHDYIVSKRLKDLVGKIDIIHTWSLGALRTLKEAAKLGIPTVLERPNAHTRFAYEVVQKESEKLGVFLPPGHEHFYDKKILKKEEEEYNLADYLLCPSDFVVKTFVDQGFALKKLKRHIYGYDEKRFYPDSRESENKNGITMLFVGVAAVRKGLHYALEAWLESPAHDDGTFLIAGEFLPDYERKLSTMLAEPSVHILGHRNDVPELMRKSDILVLPSIEEGFGLVVAEAMGSGSVPLISNACTDICKQGINGLVHDVGDVKTLSKQITALHEDRSLLNRLRNGALDTAPKVTWRAAGVKLHQVYREVINQYSQKTKINP